MTSYKLFKVFASYLKTHVPRDAGSFRAGQLGEFASAIIVLFMKSMKIACWYLLSMSVIAEKFTENLKK